MKPAKRQGRKKAASASGIAPELTAREAECLTHATKGRTNGEIAAMLSISENTVRFHFKNILKKLDARSRAEAVAKAWLPPKGRGDDVSARVLPPQSHPKG